MNFILGYLQEKIPREIGLEVLSFLIPDKDAVVFRNESPKSNYNSYSHKYQVAFFKNVKIMNDNECYLTRISKNNGKHRYYMTRDLIDTIQIEYNDREIDIYHYDYHSVYIGKNLFNALLTLFIE
jgi:hypothetical protein